MSLASVPLVAVPGLGLSEDVPRRMLASLQTESCAVALPGYGLRAGRGVAVGPEPLARLLLDRLDALGVDAVVLAGHSASCQIVAAAAALAPERVVGLVLVGPTTDPRGAGWPRLAGRWLRTAMRERLWQVPLLMRDYLRVGVPTMARTMDAARRHRIETVLGAVRCPVLVVRGRHDHIAPADWVSAVAAATPLGRCAQLAAGAHMVVLTHPAEVAALVAGFLRGALR